MTQAETRRLAALMFTDLVGCSRQRGAAEARTRQWLEVHNRIIQQAVAGHRGQGIKTAGDGVAWWTAPRWSMPCLQRREGGV